jgi:hypothetical protein
VIDGSSISTGYATARARRALFRSKIHIRRRRDNLPSDQGLNALGGGAGLPFLEPVDNVEDLGMLARASFLFLLTRLLGRALRAPWRRLVAMNDAKQVESSPVAVDSVPSAAVVVWAAPGELAAVAPPPPPNPAVVYLMGLAPGDSRRTQGSALRAAARFFASEFPALGSAESLAWHELRYEHTQALRSYLAERRSPATANRHIAALRRVLRTAWRLGQMALEDYERAADVRLVKGVRVSKGRALDEGELMGLLGPPRTI